MIDLSILAVRGGDVGQYYVEDCWADRTTAYGIVIGRCPTKGQDQFEGLCAYHYEEIIGE